MVGSHDRRCLQLSPKMYYYASPTLRSEPTLPLKNHSKYGKSNHTCCCFVWGVSLTCPMLFYVGSFSYTLRAVLCGGVVLHYWCLFLCRKFVFHALCYLISGISFTHHIQVYVGRFSNSIRCVHWCEEFLLYSPCCFMWEISLTILRVLY